MILNQGKFVSFDDPSSSNVIGCIPIQLEQGHMNELQLLISKLPKDVKSGDVILDVSLLSKLYT